MFHSINTALFVLFSMLTKEKCEKIGPPFSKRKPQNQTAYEKTFAKKSCQIGEAKNQMSCQI